MLDEEISQYLPLADLVAYRLCRRINRLDWLEDFRGEAVMQLLIAARRYEPERAGGNVEAYLAQVIRWRLKDYGRRVGVANFQADGRGKRPQSVTSFTPVVFDKRSEPGTNDGDLEDSYNRQLLRPGFEVLSERERYCVEQTYLVGRSQADVGAELGVNESRTSQIIQRALRKMRERLLV